MGANNHLTNLASMTAILGCNYHGAPLLFGDVIQSIPAVFAKPYVYIPSVGRVDVSPNPNSQYHMSGLVQKVSIIGPNLAFAWTGSVSAAKNILQRIRDANNLQLFDWASLARLLDQDSPSLARGDIGLIGLLKDGTNWRMFARNVAHHEDTTFSLIWTGGTGAESLLAQIRNFREDSASSTGITPIHSVIALGTALSGALITHKVHHLDSLRSGYGGAYEIATIINDACDKIQDVMYVQWFGEMSEDRLSIRSPNRIFQNSYWKDLLIVRSLTLANGMRDQERDEYTLIPPVFRELTPDDTRLAPIPPLAAPIVSHQITFRALDRNVYTVTRTDFANSAGFKVLETSLPNSKHKIEIHFADKFITETAAEIHRLMRG